MPNAKGYVFGNGKIKDTLEEKKKKEIEEKIKKDKELERIKQEEEENKKKQVYFYYIRKTQICMIIMLMEYFNIFFRKLLRNINLLEWIIMIIKRKLK